MNQAIKRASSKAAKRILNLPTGRRANRRMLYVPKVSTHEHEALNAAGFSKGFAMHDGTQYVFRHGTAYRLKNALPIAQRIAARKAVKHA